MKNHKMNIILDLDETLISSIEVEEYNEKHKNDKISLPKHEMNSDYVVFERPHLQEFLDFLFANFNVMVWTAASKDYAMFIIKNVIEKNGRKLRWIFWDYHCNLSDDITNSSKNPKDISILKNNWNIHECSLDNTFIVDDKLQPENCVNILPFTFNEVNEKNEKTLLKLKDMITSDVLPGHKNLGGSISSISNNIRA